MSLWSRVVIGLESGEVLCLRLMVVRCSCARAWRYVAALGMCSLACMLCKLRARFGCAVANWQCESVSQGPQLARSSGTEGVAMSPKAPNLGHKRQKEAGKFRETRTAALIRLEMASSSGKTFARKI